MKLTFNKPRVAIIGLGLIGGSIAIGLRSLGCFVQGFDTDKKNLETGLENGVIDEAITSIASLVASFAGNDVFEKTELLIVAVPVLAMEKVFKEIAPLFNMEKIVITDVGSVKAGGVRAFESTVGDVPTNFVLGHPIAGSEKHGVHASNGALFQHHQVILTPTQSTQSECIEFVRTMWEALGATVTEMSVAHHDDILAQTSHLPHLLAFALIDTLSKQGDSLEVFDYAAGGLRDFSRIAASDPIMWRDIFESNQGPLLSILDRYLDELTELRRMIETGESGQVFVLLERAKKARDHFSLLLDKRTQ